MEVGLVTIPYYDIVYMEYTQVNGTELMPLPKKLSWLWYSKTA